MRAEKTLGRYISPALLTLLLLALGGLGYLTFLAFVKGVLATREFAAYGLVLTSVAAGTASFFSPCSFTVLPGYLAFAGSSGEGEEPGRKSQSALKNGLVAAFGVVTAVVIIGALIGALGTGIGPGLSITGSDPNPASQALRITIGAFVLSMGLLHLFNLSHKVPLLGRISAWAIGKQDEGGPSLRSVYLYGAGYVLVGIG